MSQGTSQSTLSTYTASDGDNIAVQDWPLPDGIDLRGVVVMVHGLGEHAGRYDAIARRLNSWGFAVRGYDQYGHGESDGARGVLPVAQRLIDDLADIVDSTRKRMEPGLALIVLGHSLGGLVAAQMVAQGEVPVEGLVLSSPAFDPGLNSFQRFLVTLLPRIAPNLTVSNNLDANWLSHDPAVVSAYQADPLVHDRISSRLARFIADGGPAVMRHTPLWSTPTLLMYAGTDRIVDPGGSRAFAAATPLGMVTERCFQGLYHEIINEPPALAAPVYALLKQWLDERF